MSGVTERTNGVTGTPNTYNFLMIRYFRRAGKTLPTGETRAGFLRGRQTTQAGHLRGDPAIYTGAQQVLPVLLKREPPCDVPRPEVLDRGTHPWAAPTRVLFLAARER